MKVISLWVARHTHRQIYIAHNSQFQPISSAAFGTNLHMNWKLKMINFVAVLLSKLYANNFIAFVYFGPIRKFNLYSKKISFASRFVLIFINVAKTAFHDCLWKQTAKKLTDKWFIKCDFAPIFWIISQNLSISLLETSYLDAKEFACEISIWIIYLFSLVLCVDHPLTYISGLFIC